MTAIRSLGMNDDIGFPPVQLSYLTTKDRYLTGGSTQSNVIPFRQREKESSVHCASVDVAFQNGGMCLLRNVSFYAYLNFLTKHLDSCDSRCLLRYRRLASNWPGEFIRQLNPLLNLSSFS